MEEKDDQSTFSAEIEIGFFGNHSVKLDSALRLPFPAKFRQVLEKRYPLHGNTVVVFPDNRKLKLLSVPAWLEIEKQLKAVPEFDPDGDALKSYIMGHMSVCPLDTQNRIRLTEKQCELAELKKEAVVVGRGDKMELWSAENWEEFTKSSKVDIQKSMAALFARTSLPRV